MEVCSVFLEVCPVCLAQPECGSDVIFAGFKQVVRQSSQNGASIATRLPVTVAIPSTLYRCCIAFL